MRINEQELRAKGWKQEEIKKAQMIIKKAEQRKHRGIIFLERFTYWFIIALVIAGTFIFSLILTPLMLKAPTALVYLVTILVGMSLGAMFVIVINNIEHIKIGHHIFHTVLIAAVAAINLVLVITQANMIVLENNIGHVQSAIWITVVFIAALLAPYAVSGLIRSRKKWKSR